ncbi:MAG: hypothetical protein WBD58_20075 [Geitlerinemataceae cyanobacterium]
MALPIAIISLNGQSRPWELAVGGFWTTAFPALVATSWTPVRLDIGKVERTPTHVTVSIAQRFVDF